MKTPEEIKKGLVCCGVMKSRDNPCQICPYRKQCQEQDEPDCLLPDAHAYINQLEERIDLLEERINLMLIQMQGDCGVCKHKAHDKACITCLQEPNKPMWEYEGLPELPGKDECHEKPV